MQLNMDRPGVTIFLQGNAALARGALEAGVDYATSYPGSPTVEILELLAQVARQCGFYAEWSVNEKVAVEGAAAASLAGLRALAITKADGLNVALDFLTCLGLTGVRGGLVLVVGDDPSGHSSVKEEDTRFLARVAHLPVLEPTTPQEAKEMVGVAFRLSEHLAQPVVLRTVTRICHAGGNVILGPLPQERRRPSLGTEDRFICVPRQHLQQEQKLREAAKLAEAWNLVSYEGPAKAETLIVASGPGLLYAREVVKRLQRQDQVGLVGLKMVWPLPETVLQRYLQVARRVLVVEEIEPFIEEQIAALIGRNAGEWPLLRLYGRKDNTIAGSFGGGCGELTPDLVRAALTTILGLSAPEETGFRTEFRPPERELAFCAGCPHRASFWALQSAIALDGRRAVVLGDIGCYTLGRGRSGYRVLHTVHAMGSGLGLASGFGKLKEWNWERPTVAVLGDSTFYHAALPALINALYNRSDLLLVILDNETTAMTGHQPHPGREVDARGEPAKPVSLEQILQGLGVPLKIQDPYDVRSSMRAIYRALKEEDVRALILRAPCALLRDRKLAQLRTYVDQMRCLGEGCGCNVFCSRVWACPANRWDGLRGKAYIDETLCTGCGACAQLCPAGAIRTEGGEAPWREG